MPLALKNPQTGLKDRYNIAQSGAKRNVVNLGKLPCHCVHDMPTFQASNNIFNKPRPTLRCDLGCAIPALQA